VIMACYTMKQWQINQHLSELATLARKEQIRTQEVAAHAVRLSVEFRLRLAATAMRDGIQEPRGLIILVLNKSWSSWDPDELAAAFNPDQIDAIMRAFLAVEHAYNGIRSLVMLADRWGGPVKWFRPVPEIPSLRSSVQGLATQTLPVILEAQQACGFEHSDGQTLENTDLP